MNRDMPAAAWDVLMCPQCGSDLRSEERGFACEGCAALFEHSASGRPDLRLRAEKRVAHEYVLGRPLDPDPGWGAAPLPMRDDPEVDYSGFDVPFHLTRELLSHFPRAGSNGALALDLGCGKAIHRRVCEHAGFAYVGMDHGNDEAPMLGDAHAIPFRDRSFELVLSVNVLEHIRHPVVMMREVHRVLKPGGRFIGAVAFLEPFHGDSYYHHTYLGACNSLLEGGFRIEHVSPNADWPVMTALAEMGLFPRMPKLIARSMVWPVQVLHRLWWRLGGVVSPAKASEGIRLAKMSGSFFFVTAK